MKKLLRRGIAGLLCCMMIFSSSFGNYMGMDTLKAEAATKEDIRLQGIDVSHHQKQIDWAKVKATGIDYAIIRCGYGQDVTLQDDLQWKANADGCTAQGIPFGVYLYSYATTVEAAEGEADHVLRLIEGYDLQYPVYYDIEYEKQKTLGAKKLGQIASAFAKKIEDAGYQVGIYASYNWFQNYLTDPVFDQWERWVARYNTYCGYSKPYSMWQYSSSGKVSGINQTISVDMDYVIGTDVITKVKGISFDKTMLELKEGEQTSLAAEVMPKNAMNKNITWSSSDQSVVTVSAVGEIQAIREGNATITAVSKENNSIMASCGVTVKSIADSIETPTPSAIVTEEPKPTEVVTVAPIPTAIVTEEPKPTEVVTGTPIPTVVVTEEPKPTEVVTGTPIPTAVVTEEPKPTEVVTETPIPTAIVTEEPKPTEVVTETPIPTAIVTETPKPTKTPIPTAIVTKEPEPTSKITATPKVTATPKPTTKVSVTPKPTVTVKTVKGLSYKAVTKNEIALTWKKDSNATGYMVYYYDSSTKKDVLLKNIGKNQTVSYKVEKIKGKKLQPGTVYAFKVAAYKSVKGKKYYGKKATITGVTKPDTVKIKKVKRISAGKARVEWKTISRATGYVVYISDKKNGNYRAYQTVIGKKKKTLTITGLKKKKVYYIRVCAYIKQKDSSWYGNYYKTMQVPK